MVDTREFERKADLLVNAKSSMKFRLILSNGNLIERIISPIMVGNTIRCYRDQKIVYKPINPIEDIQIISTKSLRLIQNIENPSIRSEGNCVKHIIIELLKMKYEVITM